MKIITRTLAAVIACILLVMTAGCGRDEIINPTETLNSGYKLLMGETIPEGYAVDFNVVYENEGKIISIIGTRNATSAYASVGIDHSKIYYDFTDIYKRTGNTVYLNLDMMLNMFEYLGFLLPDTTAFSGKTVAFNLSDIPDNVKAGISTVFTSFQSFHDKAYTVNTNDGATEMSAESVTALYSGFIADLNGRPDEMAGMWNSVIALIFGGEHKELVKETYDLYLKVPEATFWMYEPEMGRYMHEDILELFRYRSEMYAENPTAKVSESVSYTDGRETVFSYTALSALTTNDGNDKSSRLQITAKVIPTPEDYAAKCSVTEDKRIPPETFFSVLRNNMKDLINAVYETDDYPYDAVVNGNSLTLTQANDIFTETVDYVFLNNRLDRVTVSYKTNTVTAHNMLAYRYERNGFKLVKNESAALNEGTGQGILIYESERGSDFPQGYDSCSNPQQLFDIILPSDTPLYWGTK